MSRVGSVDDRGRGGHRRARKRQVAIRQAFEEFLLVPTCLIAGFLLLAAVTFTIDRSDAAWLKPVRELLQTHVFADPERTGQILGTIAEGMITITSITVSLLLIALQQSASALTHQVYDQFLRNWQNQLYFGFFVGVSLYALITLASVGPLNPVIGASVALLSTVLALYLLLVLFYTTVNQMRPVVIIEAIHAYALAAREVQRTLLGQTRRSSRLETTLSVPVDAVAHGFVTRIDLEPIKAAAIAASAEVEVVLRIRVGDYVVFGQVLADVKARTEDDAHAVGSVLEEAIHREVKRDIALDPMDGIEELETIGWTSISSAQSDPDAGILTIYSLRDILARWLDAPAPTSDETIAPIVYADDVVPRLLSSFESLAVSASESMQHQSYAEILRTFELLYDRLPPPLQSRVEDVVLRTLSGLGDHVLTSELETVLTGLIATFDKAGRTKTARALLAAREALAGSIGKLGGRSTRADGDASVPTRSTR